jgi:hypothetical protein
MFGAMHDRLGVANQRPDADGIVRKYPLRWEESTFFLPSMVQRTAELAGADLAQVPHQMSLNWRNKQGRYNRISFSDVLLDNIKPEQANGFKNAYVVLSLSAPGLGQTKPTSVMSVEDDGEILATALDDVADHIYAAGKKIMFYHINTDDHGLRKFAELIELSAEQVAKAVNELKDMKNLRNITDAIVRINSIENQADDLFDQSIERLFAEVDDVKEVIKLREIYQVLENATDKCEDAGNVVESIIIKYA